MDAMMGQKSQVLASAIRSQVEHALDAEFENLKKDMCDRVNNLVDAYKREVTQNMHVSVDTEAVSGRTGINFRVSIDDTKAKEMLLSKGW